MQEYIEIPSKLVENEDIFSELLDSSINYANRLPSKKK